MYYPKSQVKINLYSNNNFAILATGELYTGPYWQNSSGRYYTGNTPQDLPSQEIIPSNSNPGNPSGNLNITDREPLLYNEFLTTSDNVVIYKNLIGTPEFIFNLIPYYSPLKPIEQDYQNGEFRRLFCKKTNEIQYIEIDQDQFDKLIAKDPQILWQLYEPFDLTWQLTGDKQQVGRVNFNTVELTSKRRKLPKLGDYLKFDYIKYYK